MIKTNYKSDKSLTGLPGLLCFWYQINQRGHNIDKWNKITVWSLLEASKTKTLSGAFIFHAGLHVMGAFKLCYCYMHV